MLGGVPGIEARYCVGAAPKARRIVAGDVTPADMDAVWNGLRRGDGVRKLVLAGVPVYVCEFSPLLAQLGIATARLWGLEAETAIERNRFALLSKVRGENWARTIWRCRRARADWDGVAADDAGDRAGGEPLEILDEQRHGRVVELVFELTEIALKLIAQRICFVAGLDLFALHILNDEAGFFDPDLDLHLERFLFQRAAQRDQFRQHGLFAFGQEGVDLGGKFAGLGDEFLFIEGQ